MTGRHEAHTPPHKRLRSDSKSNILVFTTGHSGEEFIKFQDFEELAATDIANAITEAYH